MPAYLSNSCLAKQDQLDAAARLGGVPRVSHDGNLEDRCENR